MDGAGVEGLFQLLAEWAEPPISLQVVDEVEKGADREEEVPHLHPLIPASSEA
jgi:hypothetical protein